MLANGFIDPDWVDAPKTVLLVDDNPFVLKWVHAQLEQCGYNLLEACDGADALLIAELHRGHIDLVVTDVVMPNVNGPELVTELLKLRPGIKFLYMSGYPEPFLQEHGPLPKSTNYLAKPFPMTVLLEKIGLALQDKAGRADCGD